ncbi:MAG TPA: hypothetical protein VH325_18385 [Bryobacteraceae bacterium]|jgi:hypothetical protein|nr:hypothetical protein [Bryobacteraceae bacterium]
MRSLLLNGAAAVLFLYSANAVLGQSVPKPGQIAAVPEVVVPPAAFSSNSSSAVLPSIDIARVETAHDRKVNRIWIASMLAMVGATSLDAGTSWGKREANGFLASSDGTFGAKGLGIKAGMAAGVILPEILLRHKDLKSKFAVGNFAEAAIFTGVSVHNLRITPAK